MCGKVDCGGDIGSGELSSGLMSAGRLPTYRSIGRAVELASEKFSMVLFADLRQKIRIAARIWAKTRDSDYAFRFYIWERRA